VQLDISYNKLKTINFIHPLIELEKFDASHNEIDILDLETVFNNMD